MEQKATSKKKHLTVWQRIAEKHGVTDTYVRMIAHGKRTPGKKKGLAVKADLDKIDSILD